MFGIGFTAHGANIDHRTMQRERVEAVAGGLFASGLPIGIDHHALRRAEHFKAVVGAVEQHFEIEFHVAQPVIKAGAVMVPGCENEAAEQLDARLL